MIFPAGSGEFWMWVQSWVADVRIHYTRLTPTLSTKDKCDALLLNTSEAYEPEAIAGFRDWFAETSRTVYAVGPLVSIRDQVVVPWKEFSTNPTEVETFLEQALNDHGEKSLVYVCIFRISAFSLMSSRSFGCRCPLGLCSGRLNLRKSLHS